jgi:predicted transcriptional regulator
LEPTLFHRGTAVSLRLPAEQADALAAIADIDEVSVNEEIRQAIAAHIEARRQDADFQRRLEVSIERNKEILERLSR